LYTLFTAALFAIARGWKEPSVHQCMMDKQNVQFSLKRKEDDDTWMNLEDSILSKISQ
jgi:hypothetical protein